MANRFNPFILPQVAMPAQAALPISPFVRPQIAMPAQAALPVGYAGPGQYRIVAKLNLRSTPNTRNPPLTVAPTGWTVKVLGPAPNGWVEVDPSNFYFSGVIRVGPGPQPANPPQPVRYLCMSCPEAPGGPWLIPDSSQDPGFPIG